MNNKSWIALFFGLACLVLLIGIFSVSNNMNNTGKNNTTPQQINQNLMTTPKSNEKLPSEIDSNEILNNSQTPSVTNTPDMKINSNNTNQEKMSVPNITE